MKNWIIASKILTVVMVLVISMSLFGCTNSSVKIISQSSNNNTSETAPNVVIQKDPNVLDKDKLLTQELTSEKEVLGGQVYLQNDVVFATMLIKNEVKEEDAKKLAQKYADELRQKYAGKKINVQAVQNGRNVANLAY